MKLVDHIALPRPQSHGLPSTVEREIKFTIGPDFRLPPALGVPRPPRLIVSTYYDTPLLDLTHAGITLRYRVEKEKRAWQLKLPLARDRQEVEVPDSRGTPPPSLLDLLVLYLKHQPPSPLVTLRVRRTSVIVRRKRRPVAEVSLDLVTAIKDGRITLRFRELEIERLNTDEDAFEELERLVRQAGAREHDGRPKVFRALSLPVPEATTPPKADAPIREHLSWTLTRHVRWLIAHDPGTRLGTESESLHQMRVAVRRLRSVLRAARPILAAGWTAPLSDELAWLGECLGRVRDLDVQIAYFRGELTHLEKPDRPPLKQLVTQLETQRAHAQQALLSELTSARYFDLIHRLEQAAHDPPLVESADSKMLKKLARREFKKLRKAIRRLEPEPRDETLHAIRIKTKRARYAAELAAPLVGKAAARFIKQASMVQDVLGAYQDAVTAESYIRSFFKASSGARAAFVAGRLIERQRHRRETLRKDLPALFKVLLKRGKQAWE